MGNDGVHDLDIARWGLGVDDASDDASRRIGGKYFFDDDQQFPDTQTVLFEYAGDGKLAQEAAHLRAAHLVPVRPGRLRERQRLLRHQGACWSWGTPSAGNCSASGTS